MTRTANAKTAGVTSFVYLAAGISSLVLAGRPHAVEVVSLFTSLCALVMGVTLYAITREEDADIATLGLACRVIEAVPGPGEIYFAVGTLAFSWLLLRGRMIPAGLGRLGVLAAILLVVVLPLERAGVFGAAGWASSAAWLLRLPMLVFELALAVWFLAVGVASPSRAIRHETA